MINQSFCESQNLIRFCEKRRNLAETLRLDLQSIEQDSEKLQRQAELKWDYNIPT